MQRRDFLRGIVHGAVVAAAAPLARAEGFLGVDFGAGDTTVVRVLTKTNFAALDAPSRMLWSRNLWAATRDNYFASRFLGDDRAIIRRVTLIGDQDSESYRNYYRQRHHRRRARKACKRRGRAGGCEDQAYAGLAASEPIHAHRGQGLAYVCGVVQ